MFNKLGNIKKRTLAFFLAVPLLAVTSVATAACPVCDGTGTLDTTPGMEDVKIQEYDTWEWRITRDACGLFILYYWDVDIRLVNEGEEEVEGWVKHTLYDITSDDKPVIDEQYRPISLSGEAIVDESYTVVFGTGVDAWGKTDIEVEIMEGDIPDPTCDGTGRVPSNVWIFADGLKDSLEEAIRDEMEYTPPQTIDWEDYDYFDE